MANPSFKADGHKGRWDAAYARGLTRRQASHDLRALEVATVRAWIDGAGPKSDTLSPRSQSVRA